MSIRTFVGVTLLVLFASGVAILENARLDNNVMAEENNAALKEYIKQRDLAFQKSGANSLEDLSRPHYGIGAVTHKINGEAVVQYAIVDAYTGANHKYKIEITPMMVSLDSNEQTKEEKIGQGITFYETSSLLKTNGPREARLLGNARITVPSKANALLIRSETIDRGQSIRPVNYLVLLSNKAVPSAMVVTPKKKASSTSSIVSTSSPMYDACDCQPVSNSCCSGMMCICCADKEINISCVYCILTCTECTLGN